MLYNFLQTNKNSHFFLLYGLGVLQMILYRYLLLELPITAFSIAETLLMCLLLLVNTSTISFIIRKNQLSEGNLLVLFFWLALSMLFPELYKDSMVMLANTCILLVILQIMQSHSIADGRQAFFDISVLIFLASLFFLPSLLALLLWLFLRCFLSFFWQQHFFWAGKMSCFCVFITYLPLMFFHFYNTNMCHS